MQHDLQFLMVDKGQVYFVLVEFADLFDPALGVPVLLVTFIALLELAKETLVDITQAEAYAPIYVRLAYAPVN